ncbi:putative ATP-dependent rRNA helicase rrp-3 [Rosellinia necatrix]|uniref:ATP-dependent rRNA helicase RRP3 n=1 Tax=Rosellinia necatrix TaxID=77044 RepID=A0A1S7UQA7_ROSNE|nr:putative ATP-dependent rRNA helicase rrp-3 [Rosellinia necatrix]
MASTEPDQDASHVATIPEAEEDEAAADTTKTFKDLGLSDSLVDACRQLGYSAPTPIQRKAIPIALSGRDLIGLAETGSGKTAAFLLPILHALLDAPSPYFALVLSPTRELATQIAHDAAALGASIALKTTTIVGGLSMVDQAVALARRPHIIVATPGRLLDHLENTKGFSLKNLAYLVIDEADRLLDDMDFGPTLEKILQCLPRDRKTLLFSATMSSKVAALQRASLRDPIKVQVSSNAHQTVSTLVQNYIFIPHAHKDIYLVYLVEQFAGRSTVIFTRTIYEAQRIPLVLRSLGFSAIPLHGQLPQSARLGALSKFKSGSRNILVATDVAARGLDIPKIALVINYDLPQDSTTYIHRVGRTARAGQSGRSISMVTQYDLEVWLRIEAALGKKVEEYATERDEVMVFRRRVEEGCRYARSEMGNQRANGTSTIGAKPQRIGKQKGRGGRLKRHGDNDREEQ